MDDGDAGRPASGTLPQVSTTRRYFGGLFIGSHAVSEGMLTRRQLESGLFRRVLQNVYVEPGVVIDHTVKAQAAALLMPAEAAIGGRSAAAWFGAPFTPASDPVLVVVPRGCRWNGPLGVRVHRTDLHPDGIWTDDDGVRLTSVARTAWDIATLESTLTAVALLDGMLHEEMRTGTGLTCQQLVAEFTRRRGRWRSARAAKLLALVDGRAMSPPESKVRVVCSLAGLPRPIPQYEVFADGAFLGQVDLAWPDAKLIVEYEGAYHFDELQIVKDDGRYARMVAAGWRIIRLSSLDLQDLDAVAERIAAALAEVGAVV